MRYGPGVYDTPLLSTLFHQPPHHLFQTIGVGEDIVEAGAVRAGNFLTQLPPGLVEQGDVFLAAVKVQAADGFALAVVEEDEIQGHSMTLSIFSRMVATELFPSLEKANQRFPKSFREAPR